MLPCSKNKDFTCKSTPCPWLPVEGGGKPKEPSGYRPRRCREEKRKVVEKERNVFYYEWQ
jgi:hypothetical protein